MVVRRGFGEPFGAGGPENRPERRKCDERFGDLKGFTTVRTSQHRSRLLKEGISNAMHARRSSYVGRESREPGLGKCLESEFRSCDCATHRSPNKAGAKLNGKWRDCEMILEAGSRRRMQMESVEPGSVTGSFTARLPVFFALPGLGTAATALKRSRTTAVSLRSFGSQTVRGRLLVSSGRSNAVAEAPQLSIVVRSDASQKN
jgi:hypothetical protein